MKLNLGANNFEGGGGGVIQVNRPTFWGRIVWDRSSLGANSFGKCPYNISSSVLLNSIINTDLSLRYRSSIIIII